MPSRTIYVSDEDLPKWEALKNKSKFVHNALNKVAVSTPVLPAQPLQVNPKSRHFIPPRISRPRPAEPTYEPMEPTA